MDNKSDRFSLETIGGRTSPTIALVNEQTRKRMEVVQSGHCPDCNESLRWCECNPKSSLFE